MGAVGRAEGIVYIEISQRSEPFGQRSVVLLFPRVEPGILRDCHTTSRHSLRSSDRIGRCGIREEGDRSAEHFLQCLDHRLHGVLRVGSVLGTAEM
jgi:hypothetical protein